jgi:hypothetical protein
MGYIGKSPEHGRYGKLDQINGTFNGSNVTFNLTVDSESVYPTNPQTLIISLNGVIQQPGTDFTVSAATITFTTAPASGVGFFGVLLGDTLDIGTPSDGSVTVAKMADNSVDSDQYVDGSIDLAHMSVNSIDSDQYVDGSIDLAHMSVNSIDSDQYVDGSIDNIHLATGIDAVKLADGTVTNAELQHINTLSSNAQTQLTAKAPLASPVFTTSIRITPQSSAPGSPATGMIYFDTEDQVTYVWADTEWRPLNTAPFSTTGGTITTYSGYKVHSFFVAGNSSSTNNFVVIGAAVDVDYLVVAGGGGGGGAWYSGGGGAGGVLTTASHSLAVGTYTITVGAGGAGGVATSGGSVNGSNSSLAAIAVAVGGGHGGDGSAGAGAAGGSGGGGAGNGSANVHAGGSATAGQGNAGGTNAASYLAAGGGGAGGVGATGGTTTSSNGGAGIQNLYRTGSNVWYAAGGAGNQYGNSTSPAYTDRKNGIGGAATRHHLGITEVTATGDALDYGSGGGGSDQRVTSYTRAGNGSAGLVVIRYAV